MASPKKQVALRGGKNTTALAEDRGKYGKEPDISETLSLMSEYKEDILARLRTREGADIITSDLTNAMLQSVVNVLPSLEEFALKSPKGVYPLENMLSIARELAHDIRSQQDRNTMRERIMNGIIDPALLRFAQGQITSLNQLERKVRADPQASEFIVGLRSNVANTINETRIAVSNSLDAYFGGEGKAKGILEKEDIVVEAYTPDDGSIAQALADAKPIAAKVRRYGKR